MSMGRGWKGCQSANGWVQTDGPAVGTLFVFVAQKQPEEKGPWILPKVGQAKFREFWLTTPHESEPTLTWVEDDGQKMHRPRETHGRTW